MTKNELYKIFERDYKQAGDTEQDFYDWAIDYLLALYNRSTK